MKPAGLSTPRLEAISDGIFAIVATLLALDVRVPDLTPSDTASRLPVELMNMWPQLLSYILAFVFVAVWWMSHHVFFHALEKSSRRLIWLNWLFLGFFCLLPAATTLLGKYPHLAWGVVPFGILSVACSAANAGMRSVASRDGLWRDHVDNDLRHHAVNRALISPAAYLIGVFLAFVDPRLAWLIYIGIPAFYYLPGRLERSIELRRVT
jgi:uncharacterized membrane protein